MQSRLAALCCACAAFWLSPAMAQQHTNNVHPANPQAAAPAPQYQSAFDGYQSFRDEKIASWREVNDEAARVGGHLGIFMGGGAHAGHGAGPQAPRAINGEDRQEMRK